ncbi:MAG: aldose 1-epimerase family protein [Lentisphaeraceae bacterium]|nr:aldose 1-epimerase family protein [Lentisphaeraceae bacterium]
MKYLILSLAVLMTGSCSVNSVLTEQVLISSSKNINVGNYEINSKDFGFKTAAWSIKKYALHGGKQEGIEIIEIDNGALIIKIIPTRGMNVLSVQSKDITLGWDSPVKEVVHPANVNLDYNGGLGWLDSFNEWMVRCGIEYSGHPGEDNGRQLTLHGRIAHIPASEVKVTVQPVAPHRITVSGVVQEKWFKGANYILETSISTVPGSNSIRFNDKVTNMASHEKEFQMLYHANFAKELLEKGSKLHGTIKSVQPFDKFALKTLGSYQTYDAPGSVAPGGEKVYQIIPFADEQGKAHFVLHNAGVDKAVSFSYSIDSLPYFTQWKNEDSMENGYVTGLEPGNSFPANRSHERKKGRIPKLKGGESVEYELEYTIHSGRENVSSALGKIQKLNTGKKVEFIKSPEH